MDNQLLLAIVYGSAAVLFILGLSPPFRYFIPIEARERIYASPAYLITMWILYAILVIPLVAEGISGEESSTGGLGEILLILLGVGLAARTIYHR